ncbi:MAG: carboxypeptidase-like regulatory domain-containing protein [Bacteroidales bacterium]
MKSFRFGLILLMFFFVLFVVACTKEIIYEWPKGDLVGKVQLNNYNGTPIPGGGVRVRVEGKTSLKETLTDSEGKFVFNDLETGLYDLVFEKDSFATNKVVSFQFTGGEYPFQMPTVNLGKLPVVEMFGFFVETGNYLSGRPYVSLYASFNTDEIWIRYFISDKEQVSPNDYLFTASSYCTNGHLDIGFSDIMISRLPKDKLLYIILCPTMSISKTAYLDTKTGKYIYPVSTAWVPRVKSFVITESTATSK